MNADRYPRIEMSVIVSVTGIAGFLISFALLHAGLSSMGIRYLVSVIGAYLVFLLLLKAWMLTKNGDFDILETADLLFDSNGDPPSQLTNQNIVTSDFSGDVPRIGNDDGNSWLPDVGFDLDEVIVVIAIIACLLAGLIASVYVVANAPVLFAEILVDGGISAALYKRLNVVRNRHWLQSAFQRTWIPALIVCVVFGTAGWVMNVAVPEAVSIGNVWAHFCS